MRKTEEGGECWQSCPDLKDAADLQIDADEHEQPDEERGPQVTVPFNFNHCSISSGFSQFSVSMLAGVEASKGKQLGNSTVVLSAGSCP